MTRTPWPTLARIGFAAALASLLALAVGLPVVADEVTPGTTKNWANGEDANYVFDATNAPPSWLQSVINDVMTTKWQDQATNNSNGPDFINQGPAEVKIYWTTGPTGVTGCDAVDWLGCADSTDTPMKIWIRADPQNAYGHRKWCHDNNVNGCPDAGRVVIHELGHIAGYLAHYPTNAWGRTRMGPVPPLKGDHSTYNTRTLGRCDEAAMQIKYDVAYLSGPYADCFDELTNAGAEGMKTVITASPTSTTVCSGTPVTITGRLDIYDGHYGRRTGQSPDYQWTLDGNALDNRVITIKRNGLAYTTATANASSGNNWSKLFTLTTPTTITYSFTAQFVVDADEPSILETGLNSSGTASFTITVVEPADC